jgi:hypothetical protein
MFMYGHNMVDDNLYNVGTPNLQRLMKRARAYLDAEQGTPESRDLILGLVLANAQLKDAALLAEKILKDTEHTKHNV